ncbi:MAG TPA: hypothetical protein VJ898_00730 [Natrialbaceae archaeon]|nr:hypothetical protein [Natrialbaceae archaeon]
MEHPLDGDITTDAEFEAALNEIVEAAEANGVSVEGGWTCNGNDGIVWDVVITAVVPADD